MLQNKLNAIRMSEFNGSASDIALYLNIALKTYYKYEQGSVKPKLDKAIEIAYKLNRDVCEIWYLD